MTTRSHRPYRALAAPLALAALTALVLTVVPAAAGAAVTAKLRVLAPDRVLDPGTSYIVADSVTVPTRPDADCFGPPGGSGAEYSYERPNVLSLLATAGRTTPSVRTLSLTDQFGFGLGICGIGGAESSLGESFWYFKVNHAEATVGADQLALRNRDEVLFYLAPDDFPNPNPAELELVAPARALAGEAFTVSVIEHGCLTDPVTFEVACESRPAEGVAIAGADAPATTGPGGTATVSIAGPGTARLLAARGADIPSERLSVCVAERLDECPRRRGKRIVGSPAGERIAGTAGSDSIRARGGADRVDLRKGGLDRVDCGKGRDRVTLRRADAGGIEVDGSCERIRRR